MYGALLSAWSGAVGLAAAIMDDPTNKTTYEVTTALASITTLFVCSLTCYDDYQVWSVGAMGLSGASLASLLLFHTEDFWFRLGLLTPSSSLKPVAIGGDSKLRKAQAAPDDGHDEVDSDDNNKTKRRSLVSLTSRFRPQTVALKTVNEADEREGSIAPTQVELQPERTESSVKAVSRSRMSRKLSVLRSARSQKRDGSQVPVDATPS